MEKVNLKQLTWHELAKLVGLIAVEMKRRNPIGINSYMGGICTARAELLEIANAEKSNPTGET